MHRLPKDALKNRSSTVEATSEIDVNDHRSIAANLIMEQPEAPVDQTSEQAAPDEEMSDDQIDQADENIEYVDEPAIKDVAEEPAETLYAVKENGVERQVTLKQLTQDFSGQSYIQQGMREVAEQRKAAEVQSAEAQAQSQRYAEAITQVNLQLANQDLQPPDKGLRETDPFLYYEQQEDYRDAMQQRDNLKQQQHILSQQQLAQESAQRDAYVQQQAANIMEAIPILADPVRGPKVLSGMMSEGKKYGFSDAEMQNETDDRFVRALHRLHVLESRGNVDTSEVKRGAIKPGAKRSMIASSQKKADAARNQMKKTGTTADVAAWLLQGN